jgi:hypothetical protein
MSKFKTIFTAISAATLVACAPAPVTASETGGMTKAEYCQYAAEFAHTVAVWKDNDISQRDVVAKVTGWEEFKKAAEKEQTMVRDYISQVYYWDWTANEAYKNVNFRCYNYDL